MPTPRRVCKRCGKNRALRFYEGPKGRFCDRCRKKRTRGTSRAARLIETHNITLAEYEAILADQDGRCAICSGERPYSLDVDHSHSLERELIEAGLAPSVARRRSHRGLLCKTCNRRLLPACRDDNHILIAAMDYLHIQHDVTQRHLKGDGPLNEEDQ